jgi:broad specificity phosphatase PhoE
MTAMLLVRHGQSTWNAEGRWQGHVGVPLTPLGRKQAAQAALAVRAVDAIVSSDLPRACETAEIIGRELGGCAVSTDARLREWEAGEWVGLTREQIEAGWPGYLAARTGPPASEDLTAFLKRVTLGLDDIQRAHPDGRVLVVTHSGVIYALERSARRPEERISNLGGLLARHVGGQLVLGERQALLSPGRETIPVNF